MRISNIVYNIDQIFTQNIFLLDNKRNIIMDGKFTKIVYSDELFMTNGIFINVPFVLDNFSVSLQVKDNTDIIQSGGSHMKCFLLFKSSDVDNEKIIQDLIHIENSILEFYKQIFKCDKKITTILKSQLYNGCIKSYIDMTEYNNLLKSKFPMMRNFVLKISGIWEDYNNIGLTYKFVTSTIPYI